MKRKQILVLTTLLLSTIFGVIVIAPKTVRADDPIPLVPTSYNGIMGSYLMGSLDNLWEKDSLYFDWYAGFTFIPPNPPTWGFNVEFFFDENVGSVNGILIELEFYYSVTIVVHYGDGSTKSGSTSQGSWSTNPNGKEVVKIVASCTYPTPTNPVCRFNQIRLDPRIILSPEEGQSYGAGHFKSSYGFDCDDSGSSPKEWTILGGTIKVIDEASSYDAHKKVVEFYDTNSNTVEMCQPLPDEYYGGMNGRINFYVKASEKKPFYIVLQDGSESNSIYLYFGSDGKIKYRDSSVHNIISYQEGKWYHFDIMYDCNPGTHWGLYINGVDQGLFNYRGDPYSLDTIRFFTSTSQREYKYYVDAIGYTWDPGYDNGDNEIAGLPVKLQGSDYYDYYIDGEHQGMLITPTISGIYYIPLPDNGEHTIQVIGGVSGADSGVISFYSDINEILDWGIDRINAEVVWGGAEDAVDVDAAYGTPSGQGINVLVLDSGVDWTHDDLWRNVKGLARDYVDDDDDPMDEYGHGTHCAGIIGAEDNDRGVIGVAPNVNIYVPRFLDEDGYGDLTDGANAIIQAIQTHYDTNPLNDIDIISMSIGQPNGDSWFEQKCNDAMEEGIILIASSGNYGTPVEFPARAASVIAVGAINEDDVRVTYANTQDEPVPWESAYGSDLFMVAPGIHINSPCVGVLDGSFVDQDNIVNDYAILGGTSMACPMVAGVVALILSASDYIRDTLTGEDRVIAVKNCLKHDPFKIGGVFYDQNGWNGEYGYGLVNAETAVAYAINYPPS